MTTFPPLAEKRHISAGSLSGGQQQMLAIGRALMARPSLLLLDEPSMGLAPILVEQIFAIIGDFKRRGLTVLLVEQNAHAALAIADRGYVIEGGRITMTGTGHALREDERVRRRISACDPGARLTPGISAPATDACPRGHGASALARRKAFAR